MGLARLQSRERHVIDADIHAQERPLGSFSAFRHDGMTIPRTSYKVIRGYEYVLQFSVPADLPVQYHIT